MVGPRRTRPGRWLTSLASGCGRPAGGQPKGCCRTSLGRERPGGPPRRRAALRSRYLGARACPPVSGAGWDLDPGVRRRRPLGVGPEPRGLRRGGPCGAEEVEKNELARLLQY
ncbi:hypothetical protein NDU88_008523 [Pleurodeles waltl]|uniref:Uncharacterized protein n=1 Tax=Pleurodeles waltl TaxID=8319 RepID=A0AAV7NWA2_PLEWA|nr:hypothetical protein NDU88_008523 [Pleurodeles waltl]